MKISELRQLIREEVREAINNKNTSNKSDDENTSNNSDDIKTNLKKEQTGKYVFSGDQADLVYDKKYNKLTPLFYTNNTSATTKDLIEKATANATFTIVNIDNEGNIDVVIT